MFYKEDHSESMPKLRYKLHISSNDACSDFDFMPLLMELRL